MKLKNLKKNEYNDKVIIIIEYYLLLHWISRWLLIYYQLIDLGWSNSNWLSHQKSYFLFTSLEFN